MFDVVVVGAGPAGSIAAIVLARAGVRVLMLDRARFPRDKLCGDSLNPGAVALLARLGLAGALDTGNPARGMTLTGERGVRINAPYPDGIVGSIIRRRDLDAWLVNRAIEEGAEFEDGVRVVAPAFTTGKDRAVNGVRVRRGNSAITTVASRLTIAADGRRSTLAFGLGLARHASIRRWAVGGYFRDVHGLSTFGEMHIRKDHYFGIAPLSDGSANVCLVTPDLASLSRYRNPTPLLLDSLRRDKALGPRLDSASLVGPPKVLGPLGVQSLPAWVPGLLLAGDAAGFIDPITGDGIYFAMRGGELAAQASIAVLSGVVSEPHAWLHDHRRREFAKKQFFNTAVSRLIASSSCVYAASLVARLIPGTVERMVAFAGDVSRES